MKQIIKNSYITVFRFTSAKECLSFANNQETKKLLSLGDMSEGDNYYCYVNYNSLTKEKQFVLLFSSDEDEGNLNLLFWGHQLVLDTGKNIYLIDESFNIKATHEITTPLVGLYLIDQGSLLVLEEAYMRVIDYNGEVLKAELFDLIHDFSIKDNILSVQTSEEKKVIDLR